MALNIKDCTITPRAVLIRFDPPPTGHESDLKDEDSYTVTALTGEAGELSITAVRFLDSIATVALSLEATDTLRPGEAVSVTVTVKGDPDDEEAEPITAMTVAIVSQPGDGPNGRGIADQIAAVAASLQKSGEDPVGADLRNAVNRLGSAIKGSDDAGSLTGAVTSVGTQIGKLSTDGGVNQSTKFPLITRSVGDGAARSGTPSIRGLVLKQAKFPATFGGN